jgi:coenzyme Q-binding protein COQ10
MPTHTEKRRMPYSADEMYALVADVESYSEFLPWCAASRVRKRQQTPEGEVIEADLVISFKVFRESFGSRVTLKPAERRIDVEYLEGPFRYLNNHWFFEPISDTVCEVDFFVDFEFRSRTLQAVIGVVFHEAMRRIVRAFEQRAEELYGGRPAA